MEEARMDMIAALRAYGELPVPKDLEDDVKIHRRLQRWRIYISYREDFFVAKRTFALENAH